MPDVPAHVELVVPEGDDSVRHVRRFVQAQLARWSVNANVVGDAMLVVSELVTNALRHGSAPRQVELDLSPGKLRIAVGDAGAGRPQPRRQVPGLEGGRGLVLLEALSEDWGTDARPVAGKRVWCELALS